MKGFSLVETLVIITIITTIAVVSVETIINFQQQSLVESSAKELVATLRQAQGKSRAGELAQGEMAADFTTNGLPTYGVSLNGSNYALIRKATPVATGTEATLTLESHVVSAGVTFSPAGFTVMFARVSGLADSALAVTLQKGTNTTARTITVLDNGLITLQ